MYKIVIDVVVVFAVILAYVFLGAFQGGVNDIITSANASTNWTGFESTQAAINSFPIYMWFIPGLVGIVAIVVNHHSQGEG